MLMAYYLQNCIPIGPNKKYLEKAFTGYKPSTKHLQIFRYIIYSDILSINKDKLEPTAYKTILINYIPMLK